MKHLKLFAFVLFAAVMTSCSSDSSSSSDGGGSGASSVVYNGVNQTLTTTIARKSENNLVVSAITADGSTMDVEFNKFGNLKEVSFWPEGASGSYGNFQNYKSHYFTFNLISIDESAHRVKISFSGNLYDDNNLLTSESKSISGNFDVTYTDVTPTIAGLDLSCKIAGSDWYATDFWDNGFGSVDRKYINDDQNQIILVFSSEDIPVGSYTFNTTSANRVQLAKYNTTTNEYVVYNATSGSLAITYNGYVGGLYHIIQGTYSFTATNPSNPADVIQVTNGAFKNNF